MRFLEDFVIMFLTLHEYIVFISLIGKMVELSGFRKSHFWVLVAEFGGKLFIDDAIPKKLSR